MDGSIELKGKATKHLCYRSMPGLISFFYVDEAVDRNSAISMLVTT